MNHITHCSYGVLMHFLLALAIFNALHIAHSDYKTQKQPFTPINRSCSLVVQQWNASHIIEPEKNT